MGKWLKGYGYAGDPYCQLCSETFRGHLIRQKSNSAQCSREAPCDDCGKILRHFPGDVWDRADAKKKKNAAGKKAAGAASRGAKQPPKQSLRANIYPNVLGNSCDRMYL
jgi:hypothetical protein